MRGRFGLIVGLVVKGYGRLIALWVDCDAIVVVGCWSIAKEAVERGIESSGGR